MGLVVLFVIAFIASCAFANAMAGFFSMAGLLTALYTLYLESELKNQESGIK